jgi:hypothetical protein
MLEVAAKIVMESREFSTDMLSRWSVDARASRNAIKARVAKHITP